MRAIKKNKGLGGNDMIVYYIKKDKQKKKEKEHRIQLVFNHRDDPSGLTRIIQDVYYTHSWNTF